MTDLPGEGPITEAEAKAAVAAEDDDEDTEPPKEPLEDALDDPVLTKEGDPE